MPGAQAPAKKALTVDDYTKWKNITAPEFSADAKWLTYGLALTNTAPTQSKPVLHLLNLQTNETVQVADATGGAFSADSAWLAYTVDPAASGRGGRGGRGADGGTGDRAGGAAPPRDSTRDTASADSAPQVTPQVTPQVPAEGRGANANVPAQPRRAELRNLSTGAVKAWQDIQSFTFSPNSTHLLLRRRPPQAAGGAAGRAGGDGAPAPVAEARWGSGHSRHAGRTTWR